MSLKWRFFLFLLIVGSLTYPTLLIVKKINHPYLAVVSSSLRENRIENAIPELIDALCDEISICYYPSHKLNTNTLPFRVKNSIKKGTKKASSNVIFSFITSNNVSATFQKRLRGIKNKTQIRIAYTLFDSGAISLELASLMNSHFDALAVPDHFLINELKKNGITLPIFELPMGIALTSFLSQEIHTDNKETFIFANLSPITEGNNQLKLVRAFHNAFGYSSKVKLWINHKNNNDPNVVTQLKTEIRNLKVKNIDFTQMHLDSDFYLDCFKEIHCYVSLPSQESFSTQSSEALALGIPLINLNPEKPETLQEVYNHYDHYLQNRENTRLLAEKSQFKNLKPLYLALIKPKKVTLGPENKVTAEGLTTTSSELIEKYQRLSGSKS